jgi:hypothetical protein
MGRLHVGKAPNMLCPLTCQRGVASSLHVNPRGDFTILAAFLVPDEK